MKRICALIVTALTLALGLVVMCGQERRIPLSLELRKIGKTNGVFFTFESFGTLAPSVDNIGVRLEVPTSADQIQPTLERALPEYCVLASRVGQHQVYHIIATNLFEDRRYALNRQCTIDFKGSLGLNQNSLLGVLQGCATNLTNPRQGTPRQLSSDITTIVEVNATNEAIRTILTRARPIARYNPILWSAETNTNMQTRMRFSGRELLTTNDLIFPEWTAW